MTIVITAEESVSREIFLINALLEGGLDVLHVRKPKFDRWQMQTYITQIPENYRSRVAIHSHHDLADELGLDRLHFTERSRLNRRDEDLATPKINTTSTHHIDDFNRLEDNWAYAFVSPVFPSISKLGYGVGNQLLPQLYQRTNRQTKLIALGGVDPDNMQDIMSANIDGVALSGAVWGSDNPLKAFQKCREIVQLS